MLPPPYWVDEYQQLALYPGWLANLSKARMVGRLPWASEEVEVSILSSKRRASSDYSTCVLPERAACTAHAPTPQSTHYKAIEHEDGCLLSLLVSIGPRASVCLGFPIGVMERWFPALYPASFR